MGLSLIDKIGGYMKGDIQDGILEIGIWGMRVGLTLILTPLVWDILWMGVRNYFHFSVCWKGYTVMITGALIMLLSWWIERRTRGAK